MKKISLLLSTAALLCACQQVPTPRNIIQAEIPDYANATPEQVGMITISGPEAPEWDSFDRADALLKYSSMKKEDKVILFESIADVYSKLPEENTLSSYTINTAIWKLVTSKGVDLSYGKDPADWHPYLMYVHPIVITEMTSFFIDAREDCISEEELNIWQKAGCNLINAHPDNLTMAYLLTRKAELEKAGITITETEGAYKASTTEMDWKLYRAERYPAPDTPAATPPEAS